MIEILHDIRDALRSARRQGGLTLVIVLTLAVGIGATTAIFTYFVEVYWQRLDAPDADRLYHVATGPPPSSYPISYADAQQYREALANLGEIALQAYAHGLTVRVPQENGRAGQTALRMVESVSPEYFDFAGARFVLGRDFLPAEHQPAGPPVTVIGHRFWTRQLGADPEVLGRSLRLNGHPFTIVGVTDRGFENDSWPTSVYVPLMRYDDLLGEAALTDRTKRRFACLLRLERGARPEEAEARLAVLAERLDQENPWPKGVERQIRLSPINALDFEATAANLMMIAAVGLLLLLASANVANLLLARAAGRRREIAVMAALGAGRFRIARRLLTESCLLAVAGGALGLLVARSILAVILHHHDRMAFGYTHYWDGSTRMDYDERVFGFTLLVALVTGCLFGLAPIVHAARTDLVSALKTNGADTRPGRRLGARHLLVITQIALATILLLVAGLLMRSLWDAEGRPLGFETDRQLMVALVGEKHPSRTSSQAEAREAWRRLYEAGRERLAALPGVEAATLTTAIPGTGKRAAANVAFPEQPDEWILVDLHQVGLGFFETFGIAIVRGRAFDRGDRAGATGAAIVNQAFVDRFFDGVEPIGRELLWPQLETDAAAGRFRVVGVIPDIRHRSRLIEPKPLVYLPLAQYLRPRFRARLEAVARTSGPPEAAMAAAREALENAHPDLGVLELGTYDRIATDLQDPEFHSALSGLFSLSGLVLAGLGIYGVMSCSVSYRRREMGVRAALGATVQDLLRLVLGEASRLTAAGILLGLALTLALSKLVASVLYGISATDPWTYLTLPSVLAAVGLLAAWVPARRAGRVDPKVVLREE